MDPRWRDLVAGARVPRRMRVLLVNATKGAALYQSLIDFIVLWQSVEPQLHITNASYFSDIYELGRGVRKRGIPTLPIEDLARCTVRQLNLLDLIICIGPSEAFTRLAYCEGLTARLVLLDLAFYHRIMALAAGGSLQEIQLASGAPTPNPVRVYSVQAGVKVMMDLERMGFPTLSANWNWRWLSYLPLGLNSLPTYRVAPLQFDVLLLGGKNRDFSLLDAADLTGLRILFLGKLEHTEQLRESYGHLDLTIRSKVPADEYHRVVAASRCILIPFDYHRSNSFLSVADPLAAGTPLLITRHIGSERLESLGAPIHFVSRDSLRATLDDVLSPNFDREAHRRRSRQFCAEHLDIGAMIFHVVSEALELECSTAPPPPQEAPCPPSS